MPHIGNELQALEAYPDLEDTTSTGGMAVLLLKLCSCTLKCGNSAQCSTLLWPHCYLWSGKPDLHFKQIIHHPSNKIWGLLKIFSPHSIRSWVQGSLAAETRLDPRESNEQKQRAVREDKDFLYLLMPGELRQRQKIPFPRASSPHHWHCMPQHHSPSFLPHSSKSL